MATRLRIGVVGCSPGARPQVNRLLEVAGVALVGCADHDQPAALAFAESFTRISEPVPSFADHAELIRHTSPHAIAIFSSQAAQYRPAMDALQANCHVFIEKPVFSHVQEAVDIACVARGRDRKVAMAHHLRLLPSLIRVRAMLDEGTIGDLSLITATLSQPCHLTQPGSMSVRGITNRGILADWGIPLVDALLWTTGKAAELVSAVQILGPSGLDLVTASSIRLAGETLLTIAISSISTGSLFEVVYHGRTGRLRATETSLVRESADGSVEFVPLPGSIGNVEANFVDSILEGVPLCCSVEQALDAIRLLEAMIRSATTGQFVGLA